MSPHHRMRCDAIDGRAGNSSGDRATMNRMKTLPGRDLFSLRRVLWDIESASSRVLHSLREADVTRSVYITAGGEQLEIQTDDQAI